MSGAAALYVRMREVHGAVIVMYHSVPSLELEPWIDPRNSIPVTKFAAQMRFLARRRNVISMTELVGGLSTGRSFDPGTVVITFDDGYLDNLEVAAPILTRLELPATLYLATGYVTRREPQWVDELYGVLRHRSRHALVLPGESELRFDLEDTAAAAIAYESVCELLLVASLAERRVLLDNVASQLAPRETPPTLTLGWAEVSELVHRHPSFEIGAHTCDHIDLTGVGAGEVEKQVRESVAEAEQHLGAEIRHFSYPYGRSSEAVRDVVSRSGLASAVVTEPARPTIAGDDVFALTRFEVTREFCRLPLVTSGAHPGLSMAFLGRA